MGSPGGGGDTAGLSQVRDFSFSFMVLLFVVAFGVFVFVFLSSVKSALKVHQS